MPTYILTQISTGKVVYEYTNDEPISVCGLDIPMDDISVQELSDHEHELREWRKAYELLQPDLDKELVDTDWSQLPDVDLTPEKVLEFKQYRASIRSIKQAIKLGAPKPEMPVKPKA